jgi:hypothetical protein
VLKPVFIASLAVCAAITLAEATEFPFEFKTLSATQAFSFGGGYGVSSQLKLARPAEVTKEPKAISAHPLYGQLGDPANKDACLFRVDESKGDGKGYDRLILDLNQNGDLTDDAVATADPATPPLDLAGQNRQLVRFGPVYMPKEKWIGQRRPVYFAEFNLYNREFSAARRDEYFWLGSLRFKAAWYLETTVDFSGAKHKLAVYDANSNGRLGDSAAPRYYNSNSNWFFPGGDNYLLDANDSGAYETSVATNEVRPFSPILYCGATPYKVALAPDGKTIQVERWPEPLVEVWLKPKGEQVQGVSLAWEAPTNQLWQDQWRLIKPGVAQGKTLLPPGNYRLFGCVLSAPGSNGQPVLASGYCRSTYPTFTFQAGKSNALLCGAPLEVKVTANRQAGSDFPPGARSGLSGLMDRVFAYVRSFDPPLVRINAEVLGAGGEAYSYYAVGDGQKSPPKPAFKIVAQTGQQLDAGTLEFG